MGVICLVIMVGVICWNGWKNFSETYDLRDYARRNGLEYYCDASGNMRNTKTGEKQYK